MLEKRVKESRLRLVKGDLTLAETEAIVYYARPDLVLGAGFGNAIAVRGGKSVQEELKSYGTLSTCDVVVTGAGLLKSKYIIHAVGPRFQEIDTEEKLRTTVGNVFKAADEKEIRKIGFPPMGSGFYGVPLDLCASVMLKTITEHLSGDTSPKEVTIYAMDEREYKAFQKYWDGKE